MTTLSNEVRRHPVVKAAIEALQRGDRAAWTALFEPDATLYDDGQPRDLQAFHRDALGQERFATFDRMSADGLEVVGVLHTEPGAISKPTFAFNGRRSNAWSNWT